MQSKFPFLGMSLFLTLLVRCCTGHIYQHCYGHQLKVGRISIVSMLKQLCRKLLAYLHPRLRSDALMLHSVTIRNLDLAMLKH